MPEPSAASGRAPTRSWSPTTTTSGASPTHDDAELFELLTLEGAQAGLSWRTILNKREGYRAAFAGFDPATVAAFTERDVERLLADAGIVRHRGKIESTINNAQRVLEVQAELGSFDTLRVVVRRRHADRRHVASSSASCRRRRRSRPR